MSEPINISVEKETAVLIGLITQKQDENLVKEYLNELAFLVETAGGIVAEKFVQKLQMPNPKTFVGSGKIKEIEKYIKENNIDIAIFDDELTPSQIRNLEKILECKILDRTNLILDIFAGRARTAHAKIQVELAQYQYLLPRLTGMWTHLSKQKGGIGLKGPGETEIETDRRIVRDKITLLKKKLKTIDKQNSIQRKNRKSLVRIALVGYTNVGKTTILNMLSKSNIFTENKLFATLDTTVRKIVIKNLPFLLSDTVGFIRKLPYNLVESFKSTLDEVVEADILIHVVDISHPNFEQQINVVKQTLTDINAVNKPTIMLFNKIDILNKSEIYLQNNNINNLKNIWIAKSNMPCLFISAKYKKNIEELKQVLYNKAKEIHCKRYPYNNLLY